MCSSEAKVTMGVSMSPPPVARINGRPVLQPTCNRVPSLERRNSVKKLTASLSLPPFPQSSSSTSPPSPRVSYASPTPPVSPKSKSPRPPAIKRGNELNLSSEKVVITPSTAKLLERKKSKSFKGSDNVDSALNYSPEAALSFPSSMITEAPGSIAAVRREQIALQHAQRKMKIAHYGRSKSARFETSPSPLTESAVDLRDHAVVAVEEKRCSFITANSDPIYVAYHDQEWGVPVHDDKMLFELLVLSGAQVGSDWTSILKKRDEFRKAFSWFDAETLATFSEKQMVALSTQHDIHISRVRGVIDNSYTIIQIKKEFGSFDKYIWGFVNHKPISTQYKSGQRIPVKTSKSETISKDMLRRGFRFVGPTVVHSFMQAAGLTNDHLTSCHRHLRCCAVDPALTL